MQANPLLMTFIRQFFQYIPPERSGVHNIIIGITGMKHGKALVMPRSETNIFCSGSLDSCHPLGCIEPGRIKSARQFGIFFIIQVIIGHGPFSGCQHAVQPPMEENAEFAVPELLARLQVFCRRLIRLRPPGRAEREQKQ